MNNIQRNRIEEAHAWAVEHGWTPLTAEEKVEFWKAVADCTNL